jgi:hypothetical protein
MTSYLFLCEFCDLAGKVGGFLGSTLVTILSGLAGALLGLLALQYFKARFIGNHIQIEALSHVGRITNLRIYNRSPFTIRDATVYISIKHSRDDISPAGEGGKAFIVPSSPMQVYEDRISWAMEIDGDHGPKMDIHPFERQAVSFVYFNPDVANDDLQFPSEGGFSFNQKMQFTSGSSSQSRSSFRSSRIFLHYGVYKILIKVVGTDTIPATWEVILNPDKQPRPVEISSKLTDSEYENKLKEYQNVWK